MKHSLIYILLLIALNCHGQLWQDKSSTHLPEIVLSNHNTMDTEIVDIDNDGDMDMVLAIEFYKNVILLNDGNGRFADGSHLFPDRLDILDPKPYRYYPYHDSEDVAIADFDKDGRIEIVIVTEDDKTNEYYEMTDDGIFEDISNRLPGLGITNGVIAADFDNDGWTDLILANNGQNFFWRNRNGRFIDETRERLPVMIDVTQDVEAGDYDGDGDLDILVANEQDNHLLQNDGKGIFSDVSDIVFSSGISEETREADFGDVDGDGDLDIFFANVQFFTKTPAKQRLLVNQKGKYFDESLTRLKIASSGGTVDGDFYDIDMDGDLDLLCGNGTLSGTINGFTIALNDGEGNFEDATDQFLEQKVTNLVIDIEVGDFDGDQKPDIYLSCFRSPDRLYLSSH